MSNNLITLAGTGLEAVLAADRVLQKFVLDSKASTSDNEYVVARIVRHQYDDEEIKYLVSRYG